MFTGIVQAMLPIKSVEPKDGLLSFCLDFPAELMTHLVTGASVAINGVCLTATDIKGSKVSFDAVRETLLLSNLDQLTQGSMVNVEKSLHHDAEIGGHILSGHIAGTANVRSVEESSNNCRMAVEIPKEWTKYVFRKGFLAINGASLTVADLESDRVFVNLIPETLKRTNFVLLQPGDKVNIEIDAQTQTIVDTVERIMQDRYPR